MFDAFKSLFRQTSNQASASGRESSLEMPPEQTRELLAMWRFETLDGRRMAVFEPDQSTPPSGMVLFLHGHGRVLLNDNPVISSLLRKHNLSAVCPDGGQSWWLDMPSPDFDSGQTPQSWLLNSVVPWCADQLQVSSPRIALLGVSMGGQGALQLAYRHASKFPVVAAISPAVDFHQLYGSGILLDQMFPDAESARQATVVLNLHPLSWPRHQWFCCDPADTDWIDGAARLGMKLSSSGVLHERDLDTSGGGHSWEYFNRMAEPAISHIVASLNKLDTIA